MPKQVKEKIDVKLTADNPDELGYLLPDIIDIQKGANKIKEDIDLDIRCLVDIFSIVSSDSEIKKEDLEFINEMEAKYASKS